MKYCEQDISKTISAGTMKIGELDEDHLINFWKNRIKFVRVIVCPFQLW